MESVKKPLRFGTLGPASQRIASQDPGGFLSTAIFDQASRNVASLDARNYLSTTTFDAASRPIAQVNALNYVFSTAYDANSNPIQMVDPLGRISTNVMDPLGRVQASISPLGYMNTTSWDNSGRQLSQHTANGFLWTSVWDNASRQIASVSPLGYRSSTTYDQADQVVGNQNALGFIYSTVLDAAGRPIASVNPLAYRSTTVYSAASQHIASVDALGNYATTVFSANGSLIASQNQLGYITSFVLDEASQRICVVDANSGRSTTMFTNRGLVSATQDQLGQLTSYTQDPNGNNILRVDARNWSSTYTVDALSRIAQTLYIDGTRVTNTWDQAGQQLTGADVTGVYSYVWDRDSRKIATQNPTGINLTSTLDPVGNRLVLQDLFGVSSYVWDPQSRLTEIQNPINEVTTIQWDALDREQHRVLGNGMTVSHTYDGAGREILLQNISSAGVGLAIFTNSYSATDNRLTVSEIDGTLVSFSYDKSSQLVNEQRSGVNAYNNTYVWDPLGNRLQEVDSGLITTRTFNSANELLTITPSSGAVTTNSWDANGNLSVVNTGGALTTNTWSVENKLLKTAFSGGTSESYAYSQDGIRKSKTNSTGVTIYTMDELNILLETTGTGVLQARNTNHPEIWGGLASQYRGSASSFYGFDSQYSTRILVSVGGVVLDTYSFTGFGVVQDSGSGTVNPAMYGGQVGYQWDRPNWMIAGQRELDAVNGRWLSVDPLGLRSGDISVYRYVRNNPVRMTDPSGLLSTSVAWDKMWRIGDCKKPNLGSGLSGCCCGSYTTYWKWSLGHANDCDGWIVQQVTFYKNIDVGCNGTDDPKTAVWYEAWHVSELGTPPFGNPNYHDSLFYTGYEGVCGMHSLSAEAKFFCDPHKGKPLGITKAGWNDPKSACKANAGDTYCVDSPPDWWGDSSDNNEGSSPHWAKNSKQWNCCGKTKTWTSNTIASGKPSPKPPAC